MKKERDYHSISRKFFILRFHFQFTGCLKTPPTVLNHVGHLCEIELLKKPDQVDQMFENILPSIFTYTISGNRLHKYKKIFAHIKSKDCITSKFLIAQLCNLLQKLFI
jgi:hypothetical protein